MSASAEPPILENPSFFFFFQAHLQRAGLLGEGDDEVPANLWGNPVEASMMGMPSMSAGAIFGGRNMSSVSRARD